MRTLLDLGVVVVLLPAGVAGVPVFGDILLDDTDVAGVVAVAFLAFDAFGVVGTTFGAGTALGCGTVFATAAAALAGTATGTAGGVIVGIGIGIEGAGDTAFGVFFVAGAAF